MCSLSTTHLLTFWFFLPHVFIVHNSSTYILISSSPCVHCSQLIYVHFNFFFRMCSLSTTHLLTFWFFLPHVFIVHNSSTYILISSSPCVHCSQLIYLHFNFFFPMCSLFTTHLLTFWFLLPHVFIVHNSSTYILIFSSPCVHCSLLIYLHFDFFFPMCSLSTTHLLTFWFFLPHVFIVHNSSTYIFDFFFHMCSLSTTHLLTFWFFLPHVFIVHNSSTYILIFSSPCVHCPQLIYLRFDFFFPMCSLFTTHLLTFWFFLPHVFIVHNSSTYILIFSSPCVHCPQLIYLHFNFFFPMCSLFTTHLLTFWFFLPHVFIVHNSSTYILIFSSPCVHCSQLIYLHFDFFFPMCSLFTTHLLTF